MLAFSALGVLCATAMAESAGPTQVCAKFGAEGTAVCGKRARGYDV